jgi:hypothetical protein
MMARKTIISCDRCGAIIRDGDVPYRDHASVYFKLCVSGATIGEVSKSDICRPCLTATQAAMEKLIRFWDMEAE